MTDMGRYDHYTDSFIQEPKTDYILIPDRVTNGDMIKTLFPNYHIQISSGHVYLYYNHTKYYGGSWIEFDLSWWNAPYESEGE